MSDLHEQRARLWGQARALLDRASREGRNLDAVEAAEYDKLNARLDAYDRDIRDYERSRDAAYRAAFPASTPQTRASDEIAAFLRGDTPDRVLEIDPRNVQTIRHQNGSIEHRDLLVGTTTAGGNTVPTSFYRQLIESLTETTPAFRLGALMLQTTGGEPLELPTNATHGTAAIVGEGTALAENDPTFGKVTLNSWKYGQLLQISNELLQDSGVDIAGFVARDMGRALAESFGTHFTTGNGSNKPQGIFSGQYGTGVTGQTASTGLPSYENLVDMLHSINSQYRDRASWVFKDSSWGGIRKIKDGSGRYVLEPSLQVGVPDQLLGRPVVTDPNANAFGTGIVSGAIGDWSSAYAIRTAGNIRLERSDDFAFDKDLVTYRAVMRVDAKPLVVDAARVYRGGAS